MLAGTAGVITGAASTVARDNLPKNVVVVSNDKGKIAGSSLSLNAIQGVIIGGATTITDYNLTPNKVVISNADGKVATSSVSDIEVGYLYGATDSIQNQLNNKADKLTTYTKTETDVLLNAKANNTDVYGKNYIDAALSTKANVANVYDKSVLYTKTETNSLLSNKQNNLSTLLGDDTTTFQVLNGTKVKSLREGSNIQMTALTGGDEIQIEAVIPPTDLSNYYDKTYVDAVLSTKANVSNVYDKSVLYTKIEIDGFMNNKQNNLSTLVGDDATTFQVLNGTKVKSLREGSNIQMTALSGGDEIQIEAVIPPTDLSNYYTQSETNNLLNTKQNNLSTISLDIPTLTYPVLDSNEIRALRSSDHISLTISPDDNALTISTIGVYSIGQTDAAIQNAVNTKQNSLSTIPLDIPTLTYPILDTNEIRALRSSDHISLTIDPNDNALTISTIGMYSVGQTDAAIQSALDSKLIYEIQEIQTLQADTTTIAKSIEFPPGQMRCLVDTTFTDAVHTPLLDATSVVAGSVSCGNIYTKTETDNLLTGKQDVTSDLTTLLDRLTVYAETTEFSKNLLVNKSGSTISIDLQNQTDNVDHAIVTDDAASLALIRQVGNFSAQNQSIDFRTYYATTGFIAQKGADMKIGLTGGGARLKMYVNGINANNTGYDFSQDHHYPVAKLPYNSANDNPQVDINSGGMILNGSLTYSSDARLKEDVQDADRDSCAEFISLLRPVTYIRPDLALPEYTDEETGETIPEQPATERIGFLAQEVDVAMNMANCTFKNIVGQRADGFYTVDYTRIIVPLISVVQDLQQQVQELKNQIG
jgi:Cu/Ag efflux protein CusF